jgi:hypothetical protein
MATLFGDRFDVATDVLAVTLANINPVAHAAMALANLTRMEHGEAWPQYHYLTPAVARLVEAMDGERRAVAAAFGREVLPHRGALPAILRRSAGKARGHRRGTSSTTRRTGRASVTRFALRAGGRALRAGVQRSARAHRQRGHAGDRCDDHAAVHAVRAGLSCRKSVDRRARLGSATRESLLRRCAG